MDLEAIGVALGGVVAGGLAAAAASAWWWGRKLGRATRQVAKLDQARQFADQQSNQVRKQVEQLQKEVAELRVQASRAKPRVEVTVVPPAETTTEELLLRATAPSAAAEPFPQTQILPRKR
ncbi:MAG: hypothetical protein JO369_01785 [Paucibacter sp.]|nr:hypothetical protein [Roseateles sp.]